MPVQTSVLPTVTELRALWTTLQVDEELIVELLHFKLIARGGLIPVHVWTMRTLLQGLLRHFSHVGPEHLQHHVRHLKGLGRFPQYEYNALVNLELASVRSFICTASVASVLAEHMLLSVIMRDNRVARRANSLRSSAASDHLAVEGLPDFVVDVFRSLLQIPGKAVRHMLLTASCSRLVPKVCVLPGTSSMEQCYTDSMVLL
eukprot:3421834-Amphidinium_carterae.1